MAAAAPLFEMKPLRGIDFILQNSPTARKFLIETMPGGIALFDYNNDGLLDILLVNGGRITESLQAAYRLGAALLQQGKASEALPELKRANELKPEMSETLYSLGKAVSLAEDSATAEKSWLKVIEMEKEHIARGAGTFWA